ncbi:fibronectin type III-like domain-contianing protein [Litorivivens sp.]|uniref:fibronectin type III-like domain-contianing protein n=1 Tax=Litorivivens sp. TaxID=2020868 RepID=UPI00356A60E1
MEIDYGYYHGYTLFDKKNIPVDYPFGFGLSYTSFTPSSVRSIKNAVKIADGDPLKVELTVDNTGAYSGTEVIQLYIGFPESPVDRREKLLRGFRKIFLQPGERKAVSFTVP